MFKLEIKTGNDAFVGDVGREAARILRKVADRECEELGLGTEPLSGSLFDANGNRVGEWEYNPED